MDKSHFFKSVQMPFFSKKKEITPQEAVQGLNVAIENLEKKNAVVEKKIQAQMVIAKQNAKTNKSAALNALKLKKKWEKMRDENDRKLLNLEGMKDQLENSQIDMTTLKAMQVGAASMKAMHKKYNVENVDDVRMDIEEQTQMANEINDAIAQPMGYLNELDDDELADELEDLLQEDLDAELLKIDNQQLPEVPSSDLPSKSTTKPAAKSEDDELKELQSMFA